MTFSQQRIKVTNWCHSTIDTARCGGIVALLKHPFCISGHGVSLGSYEYLVYEKVFVAVAAEFGLKPVTNYTTDSKGFVRHYHEHRPLQDLLEQVSCHQLLACCCESLLATTSSIFISFEPHARQAQQASAECDE